MKMKTILLTILFLSIGHSVAEDKSPCEKSPESPACKDYLKAIMSEYPCANDINKYCAPKDLSNSDINKNVNIDELNSCLEKNITKLSKDCRQSLDIKLAHKECMDRATSKCSGLKADKEIDCMAEEQPKAFNACKKNHN